MMKSTRTNKHHRTSTKTAQPLLCDVIGFALALTLALVFSIRGSEASRPLLFAPVITPLVAPGVLRHWQPVEYEFQVDENITDAPNAASADYEHEHEHEHADVTLERLVPHLDATKHSRTWRRYASESAGINFIPITGSAFKQREGFTGASFTASATYAVEPTDAADNVLADDE
jgi:hypothetical protein